MLSIKCVGEVAESTEHALFYCVGAQKISIDFLLERVSKYTKFRVLPHLRCYFRKENSLFGIGFHVDGRPFSELASNMSHGR